MPFGGPMSAAEPVSDHDRLRLMQISVFDHGLTFMFDRVIHAF
jgi:hypothetical protein